jgi:hypothetical protein
LLKALMYCWATCAVGVHPHQVMLAEVAFPAPPPLLPPPPAQQKDEQAEDWYRREYAPAAS